jgi:CRP-like cAMP-binding protein
MVNKVASKSSKKLLRAKTIFAFDPKTHMNLTSKEKQNLDLIDKYENTNFLMEVTKLSSGTSFGQLALMNDEPRKATIKCLQTCYFATLGRLDYKRLI